MELKRIFAALICVLIIIQTLFITVSALNSVSVEQVIPIIPGITAVIKLNTASGETVDKEDCFAKFGDESLEIKNLEKFDSVKHKSTVYFLVDSSSSINSSYLSEVKKKLISYSDNLPENEKMVLMSFGLKVKTLLNGGESKDVRKQKINTLAVNESQTNLFNAIKYTVDLSQSDTSDNNDRSFAVVVSDGENYETDGGNTQQEVTETVSGHGLPIYALCIGASRQNASEFGSLARKSGGEVFTAGNASKVGSAFDNLIGSAKNVYLLSMSTKTNEVSDGTKKALMIRVSDKTTNVDIRATRWVKDDDKPTITDIKTIEESGETKIYVYYSENVLHADVPDNFVLTRNGKNAEYRFSEAEYIINNSECYTVLTPKKEIPKNSDYKLSVSNVTDSSNEQNALESGDKEYELGLKSGIVIIILNYWWILLVLAAIGALVFFVIKMMNDKKKAEVIKETHPTDVQTTAPNNIVLTTQNNFDYPGQTSEEKHHIISQTGKSVTFKVNDKKSSSIRTIKTNISGKLVVGRSDNCTIYLDDLKMSRFHFEIELVNGELWIKDLNSANGTYLNNIKINGKRKLKSNDTIIAGQATFTIIF